MSVSFNPMITTGLSENFVVSTEGFVQGTFLDDPAQRYQLEGGFVDAAQTSQPLWGGLAVKLKVPGVGTYQNGPSLLAADSLVDINGWSLFNMSSAGIITPSSNVPTYAAGMSLNFARPGSNLRICVAVENTTVLNALIGASPAVDLYWDPTNLCITNTSASGANYGPLPVQLEALSNTSKIVTFSTPNATWNNSGPAAIIRI